MHYPSPSFQRICRDRQSIRAPVGPEASSLLTGPTFLSETLFLPDQFLDSSFVAQPRIVLFDDVLFATFAFGTLSSPTSPLPPRLSGSPPSPPNPSETWGLLSSLCLPAPSFDSPEKGLAAIFHYLDLLSLRHGWTGTFLARALTHFNQWEETMSLAAYVQQLRAGAFPEEELTTALLRSTHPFVISDTPWLLPTDPPLLLLQRRP